MTRSRFLVWAATLCLALATLPAGIATAAPREHGQRSASVQLSRTAVERRVLSLIRGSTSSKPLSIAGRLGDKGYSLFAASFRVQVDDANYPDWFFGAVVEDGDAFVYAYTGRNASNGFQEYDWIMPVPRGDVVFKHHLRTFSIHTGSHLGSFGAIDMTFSPAHSGMHKEVCRKTGRRLGTILGAQGGLTGTLSFMPGTTGLPDLVTATHGRVKLFRLLATGAGCPHRPYGCFTGKEFRVLSGGDAVLRADPRFGLLQVQTETVVEGVSLYRYAVFFPDFGFFGSGDNPVTVTPSDLTIDGDVTEDLFAGSVVFERAGPAAIHSGARCRTARTPFTWREGSLDVLFDSGTFSFTGADLDAHMFWYTRAR